MSKKGFLARIQVFLEALLISKTSRRMEDAPTHGDLRAIFLLYKLGINVVRVHMTSHGIWRHKFRHMKLVIKRQRRSSGNVVGLGLRQWRTRRRLMSPSNSKMRHSSQRLSAKVR